MPNRDRLRAQKEQLNVPRDAARRSTNSPKVRSRTAAALFFATISAIALAGLNPSHAAPQRYSVATVCKADDVVELLKLNAGGPNVKTFLLGRLKACSIRLRERERAVSPQKLRECDSTSAANRAADPITLYDRLTECIGYLNPTPTPTPQVYFTAERPTVFTFALVDSTNAISARLSIEMAYQMQTRDSSRRAFANITVIAEPTWKLADYASQCANDPGVAGAVIVLTPATQGATDNYLVFTRSWTTLDTGALVAVCQHGKNARSRIVWASSIDTGGGGRDSETLLPVAALAAAISALTNRQSTTTSTMTTSSFASPRPPPPPGVPFPITQTATTSRTTNPTSDTVLFGTTLLTQLASSTVGSTPSVDAQTAAAARDALGKIVDELSAKRQSCPPQPAIESTTASWKAICRW